MPSLSQRPNRPTWHPMDGVAREQPLVQLLARAWQQQERFAQEPPVATRCWIVCRPTDRRSYVWLERDPHPTSGLKTGPK